MANPRGRPKTRQADNSPGRTTIISLKGSEPQADWLESIHKKTHIPKAVIMRLALETWAEKNGHPPFPREAE